MEMLVLSSSIMRWSGVEVPNTIPIVEEAFKIISQPDIVNPLRKKRTGGRVIMPELQLKIAHDAKPSESGFETVFPGYIPPQEENGP